MNKFKKHLTLLGLQIKTAYMALPKILAGMVVFAVLMAVVAIGLVVVSESADEEINLMKVGVVYPQGDESKEENGYIEQAFAMLGQLEAVKKACVFVSYYDEEKALNHMKKGELTAVVVLPEKFISSIIYGENTPARIIFPTSDVNNSSVVFREILRSAASDLSSAQAGIYAVDDAIAEVGGTESQKDDANMYLNLRYIAYALDRESCYEIVGTGGDVTSGAVQFYVATGMLLLFLMGGITCVQLLKAENKVVGASLKRFGVAPGANHIYKVLAVTMVFFTVTSVVYTLLALSVARFPVVAHVITTVGSIKEIIINSDGTQKIVLQYSDNALFAVLTGVLALMVLLLAVFALVGLVFKIAGKTVSGVILLFLLSVVMMFASGCFVPVSMLPEIVGQIGRYLPTSYMFDLCNQIITGNVSAVTVGVNAMYAVTFLGLAAFMENRV